MRHSHAAVLLLALALFASPATAHFPFVVPKEGANEATLVFSESLAIDEDVAIDRLADGTKLWLRDASGTQSPLKLSPAEHALNVALSGKGTRVIHGTSDFGVRQRGEGPAYLLVYYPKTILGDLFDPKTIVGGDVPVELVPAPADGGVKFQLLVNGKPVAAREVKIIEPDGGQSTQKTDAHGFTEKFARPGRYGAWARHWIDTPGKRGDQPYVQERLYATLVLDYAAPKAAANAAAPAQRLVQATPLLPLPEAVSSFGAVASEGFLYVYGGHTAPTHDYSTASVSGRFHRLNLRDPGKWEPLPSGPGLQGMNLVAHRGKIYRAGGMAPRNAPGEPKDNHSTANVVCFDPATRQWEHLPAMPSRRSSHDVAIVGDKLYAIGGDKLYAIGGWDQRGREESVWMNHTDVLDLAAPDKGWTRLEQPFVRRALIVSVLDHQIFVIGGFDADHQSQLDVDILDTRTNAWRKGPPIPGQRRNGFAPAACTLNGTIYLSVSTGEMFKLSADQAKWELYAQATPRAVHRLIPDHSRVLIVGGASKQKMVNLVEAVPAAPGAGQPQASSTPAH